VVIYVSNIKKNVLDKSEKFLFLSKILRIKNSKDILHCNLKKLTLIQISTRLTW
jgi:hypothetical protein